ncbi:probable pectin methylesterase CGR2 [Ipomoea triloba]|uniref:probable pectin methylesterase CGR2 n=1 Tax=Ipomoea triloba TaxID=35885 RepID=UPI00125D03B4|nr:probable pectin methylesterase CGR2 [Ipomoea triloba]
MSRRPGNPSRRFGGGGSLGGILHPKPRASPLVSILLVLGVVAVVVYFYRDSSGGINKVALSRIDGEMTCTSEVSRTLAYLNKAYGDSMHRVLHVGPDSCSVVSKLLKEEETEAWGVEPYDIEDADVNCKSLVHRGVVRVADIKFPLPYRPKSFSLTVVSDATDYLSPRYLNKTLPELARVSSDSLIIFTGSPGQSKAKVTELSKFGRPAKMRSSTWWSRFFNQISLEENEAANKKFQQAVTKDGYKPKCQIFHLKSYH